MTCWPGTYIRVCMAFLPGWDDVIRVTHGIRDREEVGSRMEEMTSLGVGFKITLDMYIPRGRRQPGLGLTGYGQKCKRKILAMCTCYPQVEVCASENATETIYM